MSISIIIIIIFVSIFYAYYKLANGTLPLDVSCFIVCRKYVNMKV